MEPSKLVIEFRLEYDDPDNPSGVLYEDHIRKFCHDVDWDDVESVARLTRWRGSVFGRLLGASRDTRFAWLESERDTLLDVLQRHLLTVNGQWSKIDWSWVTSSYNQSLAGTTQRAGERAAARHYTSRSKGNTVRHVSKSKPLTKDREAPTRNTRAIQAQVQNFTHPLARQIIEQAKKADKDAGTSGVDDNMDFEGGSDYNEALSEEGKADRDDEDEYLADESGDQSLDEDFDAAEDEGLGKGEESRGSRLAARKAKMEKERLAAQARYAEEERQISLLTNPRQIAKDLAGKRFLKGG